MKIKDIVKLVDKSDAFKDSVNIDEIASEMGINIYCFENQDRLTSYFFGNWYCTDSYVGYKVYFLDDIPVAVSSQLGRKMDEKIEWLSKELYKQVKEYIISISNEMAADNISIANLDEEIGVSYKIHYHSQLFKYHKDMAILRGNPVKIIKCHPGHEINSKGQYEPSLVLISHPHGDEEWIELRELDFPFNAITEQPK